MNPPRVLIVEDERALALALAATVRQAGAVSEIAPTAAIARRHLSEEGGDGFAAMVLDIGLPDENGLDFLAGLPEAERLPTIVITAHGEIGNTIAARKLEVSEFLTKPLDFAGFTGALKRILPKPEPKRESAGRGGRGSGPFIGAAPAMRPVFQQIAHACATLDPILISGETGTGRTLTAELIYRNSDATGGALGEYRPGAGKQATEIGAALERSVGGVLILEDLEYLEPDAQAELLRRWDEAPAEFPRILATAGTDLRGAVEAGRIRSDLYYRLQVLEVRLPPLRERGEDLPALVDYFLGELEPGRVVSVGEAAMGYLRGYDWPGNLRELRNVVSYALTVSGGASVIDASHLPDHLLVSDRTTEGGEDAEFDRELEIWISGKMGGEEGGEYPVYRELAHELERKLIRGLLERFDGKLARMASALQANRTTLRKRLQER